MKDILIGMLIGMVVYFFVALFWAVCGHAEPPSPRYQIAVIDTGYDIKRAHHPAKLCKTGHYDYLTQSPNLNFYHIHGTQVVDVLAQKLQLVDYCVIILQVMVEGSTNVDLGTKDEILAAAIHRAQILHVDAINYALEGSNNFPKERAAFAELEKTHIPVFIAAGNYGSGSIGANLTQNCSAWPACYKFQNFIVVGAQDEDHPKKPAKYSNYGGPVQIYAPGVYRDGEEEDWRVGTSYAAPRTLAEYILFLEHKRTGK